jgi:hypothetical protein
VDLIDSVFSKIKVTSGAGRKIKAEPDPRRRPYDPAAMKVPAMEGIIKISKRSVVVYRETAPGLGRPGG